MANTFTESPELRSRARIAANSANIAVGDFVTLSGGFIAEATTTAIIEGVANQSKVYASDNQTVAKELLSYTVADDELVVRCAISGGTITAADEGKYYSLGANGSTVDGTTESTLVGSLRMVKFISATLADFVIVNKFATV